MFVLLLLLISGVSPLTVPPPTNVTVSCRNDSVSVRWDYGKQQPETKFKVNLQGYDWNYENETTEHWCDLSHEIWKSRERFLDFLFVSVRAIQGGNLSKAADSNTFSFNSLKEVDTTCALDFPPVDVYVSESGAAVISFLNPFHFYRRLKQTIRSEDESFKFGVFPLRNHTMLKGEFGGCCPATNVTCKLDVKLPINVTCVMLKGEMFYRNGISQISVNKTEICSQDQFEVQEVVLAVLLLSIFLIIVTVIMIFICKARAWTMLRTPLPKPLIFDSQRQPLNYDPNPKEDISQVSVENPCKSLHVTLEEDDPSEDKKSLCEDSRPCEDPQVPAAGSYSSDRECLYDRRELGSEETDDDSSDNSANTDCVLIEEEEEVSPYDRGHVWADMGNGDMVRGYTESRRT
ncbi:interferon gamma receptor 1 isoform 2-T2 [Pholidichthys leucotaenia]